MADPNDQDMMIYEDHPEPLAQPDDAKESSLRDFLERHFEHLRTTDQSSQLYTTLTRLVSKDWRALWAEFTQPADHEIVSLCHENFVDPLYADFGTSYWPRKVENKKCRWRSRPLKPKQDSTI